MRFSYRFLAVAVLVVMSSINVFSWDEVGHKLTSYIAWQQMTPEVRERVFAILMSAPENSHLNTHYDAFNSRSPEIKKLELFMHASIWPDVIKNRAFKIRNKEYSRGNWHYAGIFWKQENGQAEMLKDFDGQGGIAISKLSDFEKIMRSDSHSDAEKAIALSWFLHVAGDIHNPLHNASRVTITEPKGDQGGNLFVLIPRTDNSFGLSLHGYWDSIVGRVKPRKNDAWNTDYLAPIGRKFIKKHKPKSMKDRLKTGNYDLWNKEGYNFLDSVVYNNVSRGELPSKKYRKRAFRTAREQIVLAGYRLGATMNEIFATDMATQSD